MCDVWDSLKESEKCDEVEQLRRKLAEVTAELELMKPREAASTAAGIESAAAVHLVCIGFCIVCCRFQVVC